MASPYDGIKWIALTRQFTQSLINFIGYNVIVTISDNNTSKEKITHEVRNKLLKKGLSLIGMSDKEIIFLKTKRFFH